MGESTNSRAKLRFDRRIRLEFHGATITSDAGLLACRELHDALGLTETTNECLQESRGGRNVQHRLVGLLRQSVYSRLAGYEDTNDAERLAQDPTMRVVVGDRGIDRPAASTNTMSRFETEVLTQDGNVEGLGRLNAKWVDGAMSRTPHRRVILDMDSSESPVHGDQEGSSYNGHFGSTCYHPLFVFNQFGDCEGAKLRAGNVHSAHEWRQVLEPVLSRYAEKGVRRYFRADAAFAKPDIYEYLEERRVFYAIRLPSNKVLQYEFILRGFFPMMKPTPHPHQAQWTHSSQAIIRKSVHWKVATPLHFTTPHIFVTVVGDVMSLSFHDGFDAVEDAGACVGEYPGEEADGEGVMECLCEVPCCGHAQEVAGEQIDGGGNGAA